MDFLKFVVYLLENIKVAKATNSFIWQAIVSARCFYSGLFSDLISAAASKIPASNSKSLQLQKLKGPFPGATL
jgi:hypothetical protein